MSNNTTVTVIDPFYVHIHDGSKLGASIFVCLSFVLGVPGNILVVLVHKNIKGKTTTDWMIFYIAVCDILSLINAPSYVSQFQGYWSIYNFPGFLCKLHYFSLNSVSMAAYIFTALTAFERYFKIVASKDFFDRKASCIWIPVFTAAYLSCCPTLWVTTSNANNHCMYDVSLRFLAAIQYAIVLFTSFSASIIMITCYVRVCVFLVLKMREMSSAAFEKNYKMTIHTTKMLAIVTVVFMFSSNAPYIAGFLMSLNKPDKEPEMSLTVLFGITFYFNTFFNPFLYLLMSTTFRQRTKALFNSCCYSINAPTDEKTGSTVITVSG